MPVNMDIEVPRNASYKQGWTFRDKLTKEPLDITGWTFALDVKYNAGASAVIASAIFNNIVGPDGTVDVQINGSDFSAVEGVQEKVVLAYDCLAKDIDGLVIVQTRGQVYLMPGVSTI